MHVISDPVVVRIYVWEGEDEMRSFWDNVIEILHAAYGFTFTFSHDCHLLSRNQVNVLISTLSKILYGLDVWICRVSFFVSAEPIIDHYIVRYRDQMGSSVHKGNELIWLRISVWYWWYSIVRVQRGAAAKLSICGGSCAWDVRHGGVRLNSSIDVRISRKNIYHELYHEILSVVQRMVLDDIPSICAQWGPWRSSLGPWLWDERVWAKQSAAVDWIEL